LLAFAGRLAQQKTFDADILVQVRP